MAGTSFGSAGRIVSSMPIALHFRLTIKSHVSTLVHRKYPTSVRNSVFTTDADRASPFADLGRIYRHSEKGF